MPRQEQIQPRKSRSREDAAPSTFPETYETSMRRAQGGPDGVDDLLIEIEGLLAHDDALHRLGQLGLEA